MTTPDLKQQVMNICQMSDMAYEDLKDLFDQYFVKDLILEFSNMRGEPDFYSYYVASDHRGGFDEGNRHSQEGSCDNCGYWKKVYSKSDIPDHIFETNNYRKHWESERNDTLSHLISFLKEKLS